MTQYAVSVGSVSKSIGREQVLRDIDLNVQEGEFCVIIGPSGCGKSTLLKCIAGLLDFETGQVMLNGNNVRDIPVKDANVGFVFQEFEDTLFPHKTVEDEEYGLSRSRVGSVDKSDVSRVWRPRGDSSSRRYADVSV